MYPGSQFTLDRMVINAHYTCVQATFRIKARTSGGRDPWYLFSKDLEANFLELVDSPLSTYSTGSKGDAVVIALASHQCGPVQIQASTPYVCWLCCWFSPLLREVFLWVLWFSPNLQQLTNSDSTRDQVDEEPLCGCATCFTISCLYIYCFDITVLVKT